MLAPLHDATGSRPALDPTSSHMSSRMSFHADGTIEGYASLFGALDQARDMVMPGAFAQTLWLKGPRRVPMLFQHDPAEPIGIWLDLHEDTHGLFARGRLIPDVTRARELLSLLRAGAIDGLSIGFKTVRARQEPRTRIRKLDQIDLWEISLVTFPLLPGARVRAVKEAQSGANAARLSQGGSSRPSPVRTRGWRAERFGPVRAQASRVLASGMHRESRA